MELEAKRAFSGVFSVLGETASLGGDLNKGCGSKPN